MGTLPVIYKPPGPPTTHVSQGASSSSSTSFRATHGTSTNASGTTFGSRLSKLGKKIWNKALWPATKSIAKSPAARQVQWIAGLSATALTAYSLIKDTPQKIRRESREELGKEYTNLFVGSQSTSKYSNFYAKLSGSVRDSMLDSRFYENYVKTKNAICTTIGEVADKAVPISLTAGALGAPALAGYLALPAVVGSGVAIGCTALLLAGAAKILFADVLGFGQKKL